MALEGALARPDSRHQLEELVLALARVATAEAESAAVRAALAARIEAQEAAGRAVDDLQQAIEAERSTARAARAELAEAHSALDRARDDAARVEDDLIAERERSAALEAALRQERDSATEERDTAARFWETISTLREQLTTAQQAAAGARVTDEGAHRSNVEALERRNAELTAQLEAAQKTIEAAAAQPSELAAPQETADGGSAADAQNARLLKAALERIRVLELELAERGPAPGEEVDLATLARQEPTRLEHAGERAQRFGFPPRTKIRIDHEDGQLVDLSLTGAQLICKTSPEVGRIVVVTLPSDETPCFGQGRLLWARREPTPSGRPQRYRAGLVFTDIDQTAVDAFIKKHSIG